MYTKDKSNRITLRLNEDQFAFVKTSADIVGVSPSEFLRMVINQTMAFTKLSNTSEEVSGRENDKTNINDIV